MDKKPRSNRDIQLDIYTYFHGKQNNEMIMQYVPQVTPNLEK